MKLLWMMLSALIISTSVHGKFSDAKIEYEELLNKKYILLPHNGTYLIPFSYNANPNEDAYKIITDNDPENERGSFNKELEAQFQISFLVLGSRDVFNSDFDIFLGYTHQAWWQVYNEDWSRPFRETNYAPELFGRKMLQNQREIFGLQFLGYDIGYIHQSNGQIQELSRSWDRVFLRTMFQFDNIFIQPMFWYRLKDGDNDDNPDIRKYRGFAELLVEYVNGKSHLKLRYIPGTKYQGVELSYSYPWKEGLRFFIKGGYGYGLSLIDYNHRTETIGIGLTVTDFIATFGELKDK